MLRHLSSQKYFIERTAVPGRFQPLTRLYTQRLEMTRCSRSIFLKNSRNFLDRKMEHKLPPNDAELYRRCDEVLHFVWDPIGVSGSPAARDEYDSYVPPIFALVSENASPSKIADTLVNFESDRMALSPNRTKAQEVAEILLEWRERVNEEVTRQLFGDR